MQSVSETDAPTSQRGVGHDRFTRNVVSCRHSSKIEDPAKVDTTPLVHFEQ